MKTDPEFGMVQEDVDDAVTMLNADDVQKGVDAAEAAAGIAGGAGAGKTSSEEVSKSSFLGLTSFLSDGKAKGKAATALADKKPLQPIAHSLPDLNTAGIDFFGDFGKKGLNDPSVTGLVPADQWGVAPGEARRALSINNPGNDLMQLNPIEVGE